MIGEQLERVAPGRVRPCAPDQVRRPGRQGLGLG